MVEEASSYLSYGDRARAGGLVSSVRTLRYGWRLKLSSSDDHAAAPVRSLRLGVAGVASTSASDGDQATPATVRYTYVSSQFQFVSGFWTRPGPVHEPADAMQTSLLSAQGSETLTIEAGAARLSVQGSEETKTRVEGAV
jgi:hypothetical protein